MLYALDTDPQTNIVVAGETNDPSIHPYGIGANFYPLIVFVDASTFNLNRWVKTYDTANFYVKRVQFNPSGDRIAALLSHRSLQFQPDSRVYTMNSSDGSSINHHIIQINSKDYYDYDLKMMLYYDSQNNIYVGFRQDESYDPLGQMKQSIVKFTDTATPNIIWAKASSHNGYILTMTVVESLNSVYAGGHGRDASNAQ